MWEKLKQLARRYDEIGELLEVPEIYADPKKLRALTREQKELSAVVETYRAYQKCEDDIVQALELVSDPELKDMAQEELNTAKAEKERLFDELRVLLLPRDPNDDKNVIVEIRGGVGGEESATAQRAILCDTVLVNKITDSGLPIWLDRFALICVNTFALHLCSLQIFLY